MKLISEFYDRYHELGGNGAITKLYHDMMEMPCQRDQVRQSDDNKLDRRSHRRDDD